MSKEPMTNLQTIRDCISCLTYSEMMIIAGWFANIDKDGEQPINDPSFWAYHFNEWAENVELAEDEDEQP